MPLALISRFYKWKKNRDSILKKLTNPVPLKKVLKIIERKLIISSSNEMKPPLNEN